MNNYSFKSASRIQPLHLAGRLLMKAMQRLLYFVLLVLFIGCNVKNSSTTSYPQYHRQYNTIQELIDQNKDQEALQLFAESSQFVNYIPSSHYFNMSRAASRISKCDLTESYFTKALENGYEYNKVVALKKRLSKKDFKRKYSFGACSDIIERMAKKQVAIQSKSFNKRYKAIIDSLSQQDQELRSEDADLKELQRADSTNIELLLSLIDSHGYPNSKKVGHKTAFSAYIILLHFDKDYDNAILKPILDKAFHDGYLSPNGVAWIADRRRHWGPKKLDPYYFHTPAKVYETYTMEQKNEVNFRRDSIGLKPIL